MEIKHSEWLQITTNDLILYGYNQGWYKTSFQRTRGCGPTAASMLLLYLTIREVGGLPYRSDSISSITEVLEDVWKFVTPGWLLGLNSTQKFCKGMEKLFRHYGLNWKCSRLSIAAIPSHRSSLAQVIKFLEDGIALDCPICRRSKSSSSKYFMSSMISLETISRVLLSDFPLLSLVELDQLSP